MAATEVPEMERQSWIKCPNSMAFFSGTINCKSTGMVVFENYMVSVSDYNPVLSVTIPEDFYFGNGADSQ